MTVKSQKSTLKYQSPRSKHPGGDPPPAGFGKLTVNFDTSRSKMTIWRRNLYRQVLNISCSTSHIKSLSVETELTVKYLRPQLHVILIAPPGMGKSRMLRKINDLIPKSSKIFMNITAAGLRGSISQNTENSTWPLAWDMVDKVCLVDEFLPGAELIRVLLSILEDGHYVTVLGYDAPDIKKRKSGCRLDVHHGTIDVTTNTVFIFATMFAFKYIENYSLRLAFFSRVVPIYFKLDDDELRTLLNGISFYEPKIYKVKENVVIKRKDWEIIMSVVWQNTKHREYLARNCDDCCRVFAVLGKHNMGLYYQICQWREGLDI